MSRIVLPYTHIQYFPKGFLGFILEQDYIILFVLKQNKYIIQYLRQL